MHACCIPLHIPFPIKVVWEKGLGHYPLEGITTPFPAGTTDCVRDDLFSSAVARRALLDGVSLTIDPVCGLSFHSLDSVFHRAEIFNFSEAQLINYFFHASYTLCGGSKKSSTNPSSSRIPSCYLLLLQFFT